jgi:hypothetical protein
MATDDIEADDDDDEIGDDYLAGLERDRQKRADDEIARLTAENERLRSAAATPTPTPTPAPPPRRQLPPGSMARKPGPSMAERLAKEGQPDEQPQPKPGKPTGKL